MADLAKGLLGFSLRWPPAIYSAHLGPLRIFSPIELIVAFFELGPVILLTPWITRWGWRCFQENKDDWILGVFTFMAWIGFILPIFFRYQASERDITRFTWQALLLWTLMLALMLLEGRKGRSDFWRYIGVLSLAFMVFGGVVVAGTQMTAAAQPMLAHGVDPLDAEITSHVWDRLPADSQIFSPDTTQGTVLTGRLAGTIFASQTPPGWGALINDPRVEELVAQGYQFVLVNESWWASIPEEARQSLASPCVKVMSEHWDRSRTHFRQLLDLRACD